MTIENYFLAGCIIFLIATAPVFFYFLYVFFTMRFWIEFVEREQAKPYVPVPVEGEGKEHVAGMFKVRSEYVEGAIRLSWECKPLAKDKGFGIRAFKARGTAEYQKLFGQPLWDGMIEERAERGDHWRFLFQITRPSPVFWIDADIPHEEISFSVWVLTEAQRIRELEERARIKELERKLACVETYQEDPTDALLRKIRQEVGGYIRTDREIDILEQDYIQYIRINYSDEEQIEKISRFRSLIIQVRNDLM